MDIEEKIIGLVIAVYFVATLIPNAIEMLVGVDTSNWTLAMIALWGLITIVTVIVVVRLLLGFAKHKK